MEILKEKVRKDKYWKELDDEKKFEHFKILASPFVVTENQYIKFFNDLDN